MRSPRRVGRAVPRRPQGDDETAHDTGRAQDACACARTKYQQIRQRLKPGQSPAPNPAPDCAARFAHSPTASDSMAATPSINACTARGGALPDTFQRPAQRVHRRLERIKSLASVDRALDSSGLAPALLVVSCPSPPAPHLRVQSLHRRAAPGADALCSSRRAHESNRRAARPGETPRHPRRNPLRRILRQPQPLRLTLAKQLRPRLPIARRTQRQPEQISRPPRHRLALAEHLVERPGLAERNCALNRAARPSASTSIC